MKHRVMLVTTLIGLMMWAPALAYMAIQRSSLSYAPGWWGLFPSLEVGIIVSFFAARRWKSMSRRARSIVLFAVPFLSTTTFLWLDYCRWLQKSEPLRTGAVLKFSEAVISGLPALPLAVLAVLVAGVLWCPVGVLAVRRLGLTKTEAVNA